MALSPEFVDQHIERWRQALDSPFYPHRKFWSSHLFHHAPLENAASILKGNRLLSRNDSVAVRERDVAAPGVIDARNHAHDRVRLYFRPKTPTQWNIEGIRKAGDCKYGERVHCPVLVMFALDARAVLSRPDIMFSDQNMQLGATVAGDTEEYFSAIQFAHVYSEGPHSDRRITDMRAAEVLPQSPLPVDQCLRAIYFRSEPERDTLLHALGKDANKWVGYCKVSDALQTFHKDYTFVQHIALTPDGVVFRLNHRKDGRNVSVEIKAWDQSNRLVCDFFNSDHAPQPKKPFDNWIWPLQLPNGIYLTEVKLEGLLAFRGALQLGDTLF